MSKKNNNKKKNKKKQTNKKQLYFGRAKRKAAFRHVCPATTQISLSIRILWTDCLSLESHRPGWQKRGCLRTQLWNSCLVFLCFEKYCQTAMGLWNSFLTRVAQAFKINLKRQIRTRSGNKIRSDYENTPIKYIENFTPQKTENFQIKKTHISAQKIHSGYLLETSR